MTTVVRTDPFDAKRIAEESAELDASGLDWTFAPELDAPQSVQVIAWLNKLGVMNTYVLVTNEDGLRCACWLRDTAGEA